MQLLGVVIPKLEQWQTRAQVGQRKITQWTRYLTIGLALVQSTGLRVRVPQRRRAACSASPASRAIDLIPHFDAPAGSLLIVLTLTAGTALVMWLGELITQRGIGNGMSILIFASVVSRAARRRARPIWAEGGNVPVRHRHRASASA